MKFEDLKDEDIKLIQTCMIEHSVSITSNVIENREVIPEEVYEKGLNEASRLIYLVNVLNGKSEYDK